MRISTMKAQLNSTPGQQAYAEYKRRIAAHDFKDPEELNGKTQFDLLLMPEFATNLNACIDEQVAARTQAKKAVAELRKQGKRVADTRTDIDRVMEMGLMDDAGNFAVEFANVLAKKSKLPNTLREYVNELGMRAYNMTIHQFIRNANPDLADLYKKATATTKN